jgi:hypothetical protein
MKPYYVNNNAQSNGDHEVHVEGCYYLQYIVSKTYLGLFLNANYAVVKAREYHLQVNGCAYCCPEANTD